jgi:hypothetical protein
VLALHGACGGAAPTEASSGAQDDQQSAGAASGDNDGRGDDDATGNDSSGGSSTVNDGKGNVCETLNARADPRPPEVLIVLDRSGSMAGERWDRVIAAIDNVTKSFPEVQFGLSMYPAIGEELDCKPGKLDVASSSDSQKPIHDALFADAARAIQDVGYTPTASTLRSAATFLSDVLDNPHDRYVLLVTDGQPNCNAAGPVKSSDDLEATLMALTDLENGGVRTYVFGYLTAQFATVMDQMAVAGGTEKHYAVEDEATILKAFEQISSSLAPCTFGLENDVPGVEFVRVKLDGKELEYDADGFGMAGARTIELRAKSCATMRDGGHHSVEVTVECQAVRVL